MKAEMSPSEKLWRGRNMRSRKKGDAVGRVSSESSFLGDPGAKFLGEMGKKGKKRQERNHDE
jgi:hypothetical protein